MRFVIFTMLLFPALLHSQSIVRDTIDSSDPFMPVENLLESSEKINGETFELKFLIRSLPDNGWFLKLHKDSTFEYIHWSGWGEPAGTILEKGTYTIQDNMLQIVSDKKNSELKKTEFYLITSHNASIENHITVDCAPHNGIMYCLYHR